MTHTDYIKEAQCLHVAIYELVESNRVVAFGDDKPILSVPSFDFCVISHDGKPQASLGMATVYRRSGGAWQYAKLKHKIEALGNMFIDEEIGALSLTDGGVIDAIEVSTTIRF